MLAVYQEKFGGPQVTKCAELRKPTEEDLRSGEVLVKVYGASLNPVDYKHRSGGPRPLLKVTTPVVWGFDFSGIVEAEKDTQYTKGQEVFGMIKGVRRGSMAQYLIVNGDVCAIKPEGISHVQAASFPLVGITTIKAFRSCDMVEYAKPDSLRVFILGGAGGVGSNAIQLAKGLYGATFVATTASPGAKTEFVKGLGADLVVNHREADLVSQLQGVEPFDVVYDCVGDLKRAIPVIKDGGRAVSIAMVPTTEALTEFITSAGDALGVMYGAKSILFSSVGGAIVNRLLGATSLRNKLGKRGIKYNHVIGGGSGELMAILKKEIEEGRLRAVIDKEFDLAEGIKAIEYIESGRAAGKVVISVRHDE